LVLVYRAAFDQKNDSHLLLSFPVRVLLVLLLMHFVLLFD
jgi:hypothetical protein